VNLSFKIHRGTKEIGGSCVEVWTSNTRIIIDMGMQTLKLCKKMVNAIKPKNIIPIHTFEGNSYQNIFRSNVSQCNDGDVINV